MTEKNIDTALDGKIINLECTLNKKTYYLANVPTKSCVNKNNIQTDCSTAVVVLIPEEDVMEGIRNYDSGLEEGYKKCLPIKSESICNMIKQKNQYITDFKLTKVVSSKTKKESYLIRGTAVPLLNGAYLQTLVNQSMSQLAAASNTICGDNITHDSLHNAENNIFSEITFVPSALVNPKFKSAQYTNTFVMEFTSNLVYFSKKTGKPYKIMGNIADIATYKSYIGIDTSNACLYNGKSYPRLKLFKNLEDIDIFSILHFKITNIH